MLADMGFNPNACRRAVLSTGNADAELAMNWLMEHLDDPDINDPLNCDGQAVLRLSLMSQVWRQFNQWALIKIKRRRLCKPRITM